MLRNELFFPFYQVNERNPHLGTGPGLAIYKGFLALMGRDIWVRGDGGRGSDLPAHYRSSNVSAMIAATRPMKQAATAATKRQERCVRADRKTPHRRMGRRGRTGVHGIQVDEFRSQLVGTLVSVNGASPQCPADHSLERGGTPPT
jgi:hypothetical protein